VERLSHLKEVVKTHREKFMHTILNNTEVRNLDQLLAFELAKYEAVRIVLHLPNFSSIIIH